MRPIRRPLVEAAGLAVTGALLGLVAAVAQPEGRAALSGPAPAPGVAEVACEGGSTEAEWIDQATAKGLHSRRDVIFVDARVAADFELGRVAGAVSLPWSPEVEVPDDLLERFEGCKTLVAYCDREECRDSLALAEHLLTLGVRQVRVLEGGWSDWYGLGHPVEGAGVGKP
jgi:3-mercaptopyruvate sulfurtransferase SseA